MKGPIIAAAVLLCLLLLSQIRLGAWVEYGESGFFAKIKAGALKLQVYPMEPKTERKKAEKPPKEKKETPPKGGTLAMVKELLPVVADAAGQLKRKIRLDRFWMDLLWSAPDPAACAVGFGGANAAVGMIWPLVEQNFHVKQRRIRTAVDFQAGKPTVYLQAQATLTLGQALSLLLRVGVRFLKAYLRARPAKQEASVKQAAGVSPRAE